MKIIFVHGMGNQQPGCSFAFRDRVIESVRREGKVIEEGDWHECYWADITQPNENWLYDRISRPSWPNGILHSRLFTSEGDVISYSSRSAISPNKYDEIQMRFKQRVDSCNPPSGTEKLTVIGHSLGSVIAADGLYDLLNNGTFPSNLELRVFFTFASPLALFLLQFEDLPHLPSKAPLPSNALWHNYYYKTDLVAFPLKFDGTPIDPTSSPYYNAVTDDTILSPWDGSMSLKKLFRNVIARIPGAAILSHDWYLDDTRVIRKIVSYVP